MNDFEFLYFFFENLKLHKKHEELIKKSETVYVKT